MFTAHLYCAHCEVALCLCNGRDCWIEYHAPPGSSRRACRSAQSVFNMLAANNDDDAYASDASADAGHEGLDSMEWCDPAEDQDDFYHDPEHAAPADDSQEEFV